MFNKFLTKKLITINTSRHILVLLLCLSVSLTVGAALSLETANAATAPTATCKVDSAGGVHLRKSASTTAKSLKVIKDNKKLTIKKEVFKSATSAAAGKRWYYVTYSGKSGYVRADCVDTLKYSGKDATATEALNYRSGAGTAMKVVNSLPAGSNFKVVLAVKSADKDYPDWYKIKLDSKYYYVCADYVKFGTTKLAAASDNPNRGDAARALVANPTVGGSCRVVYTFNSSNCKKRWTKGIKGLGTAKIPQGLAYTGDSYCALFALDTSDQALVMFDNDGNRIDEIKITPNCGHRNGLTWNAQTGLYYMVEGGKSVLITYNPASREFGTAKMPTSSSGICYDRETGKMIATIKSSNVGKSNVVYSGDGKFTIEKYFARCTHSGSYHTQDCGAHGGFLFHCISGSSLHTENYIDVYRVKDGAYLGSIKSELDEGESCIVNNEGYLEILCNRSGTPDYVWTTPLKVSDLN